jgi:F-type H+-transporting ATPase subunit a
MTTPTLADAAHGMAVQSFKLASESGIHVSLRAEKLFTIGPLTVTNSLVYGIIVVIALIFAMRFVAKKQSLKASKNHGVSVLEMLVDYVVSLLESPLGSRKNAVYFAPYFATFFIFVLFVNISGLLPIVGTALNVNVAGEVTPLLRPFTADLNGTAAMAVFAIILVQYLSIKKQGLKAHLQHYFTDKPLNPINMFIGLLEVIGEFTRVLSLSLRLFLNTAVGEILVAVFTSIVAKGGRTPLAVIPIIMFEILVAYIQAYVFTVLLGTYLGLATAHSDEHQSHSDKSHHHTVQSLEVETGHSA